MFGEMKQQFREFLTELKRRFFLPLYIDRMNVGTDFRSVKVTVDQSLEKPIPILLLTGWGSGFEGILPLAFSLASLGYRIILVSLPGYGESKNPPPRYWQESIFCHHAGIVKSVLETLSIKKAYLVGHSMGAEILAVLAKCNPGVCEKLVLLHPSGIRRDCCQAATLIKN